MTNAEQEQLAGKTHIEVWEWHKAQLDDPARQPQLTVTPEVRAKVAGATHPTGLRTLSIMHTEDGKFHVDGNDAKSLTRWESTFKPQLFTRIWTCYHGSSNPSQAGRASQRSMRSYSQAVSPSSAPKPTPAKSQCTDAGTITASSRPSNLRKQASAAPSDSTSTSTAAPEPKERPITPHNVSAKAARRRENQFYDITPSTQQASVNKPAGPEPNLKRVTWDPSMARCPVEDPHFNVLRGWLQNLPLRSNFDEKVFFGEFSLRKSCNVYMPRRSFIFKLFSFRRMDNKCVADISKCQFECFV